MNKQWFYRITDPDMPVDFQLAHDFPSPEYQGPFTLFAFATWNANAYLTGFRVGLTWKAPWVPGGPFTWNAQPWRTAEKNAEAAESKRANAAWCRGWRDGLAKQQQAPTVIP